jgi:hypothetical protein
MPARSGGTSVLLLTPAKAKAAYQDFLTLWKDADPDGQTRIYVARQQ